MGAMTTRMIRGSARPAGRNVVHTVTVDGEIIGTRRSAHCYSYAFVKRTRFGEYIVTRYSHSGQARGDEFPVFLEGQFV